MTFKDCKRVAGVSFLSLKSDKATAEVVFLSEPVARETEYKGQSKKQFVFPVWHEGEVKYWSVSRYTMQTIEADWSNVVAALCLITRHGKKGSTETTYAIEDASGDNGEVKEASQASREAIQFGLECIEGVELPEGYEIGAFPS